MVKIVDHRYSREVAKIQSTGEIVTPKMAIARGITKNSNDLICFQCGDSLTLAAIEEKKQKTHFRGKCTCNLEQKEVVERGFFSRGNDGQAEEVYARFQTYGGSRIKFLVKEVIHEEGYDIFLNSNGEKVVVLQINSDLNPKKFEVELVNEITENGFIYLWSSRENIEVEEKIKNYNFLKNENSKLKDDFEELRKNYRLLEIKKNKIEYIYRDSVDVRKLKNQVEILQKREDNTKALSKQIDTLNRQIKSLKKELTGYKTEKSQFKLM